MSKKIKWFFKQHQYMILSVACLFLIVMWLLDRNVENFDMIKPESLSKIAIGIIVVSIMAGYTWVLMDAIPYYKHKINPDEHHKELDHCKNLSPCQKTLITLAERFLAFLWYALLLWAGLKAISSF